MYSPFNNFVFRTPALPVNAFFQEIEKLEKDNTYWQQFLQNSLLREAIFLASPVLYDEIGKFLSGYLTKEKDVEKMKNAVLRYFSRMCSRCTPFGLFAGFSLGRFDDEMNKNPSLLHSFTPSHITLPPLSSYRRYTRLDMHYLCALAQDIGKNEAIQRSVKFYPNSSLYVLGDQLRYVEYYYKKSKRIHQISSVDYSEYLEKIIAFAQQGATFNELATSIVSMLSEENISLAEAESFIKELIDNQILVSELEPEITGKDFLVQLLRVLNETFPSIPSEAKNLEPLSAFLKKMDEQELGKSINIYKEAEEVVKTTGTAYEKNYLFQVDMFKPVANATLNNKIADEVWEAMGLMNQISFVPKETTLKKFADSFYERYEEREMPLLQVLDVESGIGYPANKGDISPLIENYMLPNNENSQNNIVFNRVQSVLHKKLLENYKTGSHFVEFTEKDFEFLKPNWENLPQTLSCMCEIFHAPSFTPSLLHSIYLCSLCRWLKRCQHVGQVLPCR